MQRKLLGALVAAFVVAGLMLVPMVASGRSENCPAGYDHKSDSPVNLVEEWGTATIVSGGSAVQFYVKDGYTVDVCVKGGKAGFTEDTIVGEDTQTVSTPTEQDVSHYEWTVSTIPPTTTPTTEPPTTTVPEETTTTQPTTTTTVEETTTTTAAPTTTTSVAVTSTTADPTTTTTEATTTTTQPTTTTTTDPELPFTGPTSSPLALSGLALALLASGLYFLRREGRLTE